MKQVHGEPAVSDGRLLAVLLPLAVLLARLLLGIRTLVQLPVALLARCFRNDLRNGVELRLPNVDGHVNVGVGRILVKRLHGLNLILRLRPIRGSLELPAVDAFVELLLMRLHDLLHLCYYLDLSFLILSDDLPQALRVVLLGSIGQPQLELLLLLLQGAGADEALAALLAGLLLRYLFGLLFGLLDLRLGLLNLLELLLGLECLPDCILSHECGDLAPEIRLPGIKAGIHDLNAALTSKGSTM